MVALLDQEGGGIRGLLSRSGAQVNTLRSALGEKLDSLPKVSGQAGQINLSNDTGRVLNLTDKIAQERGDAYIASELYVLAALDAKGNLGQLLHKAGVTKKAIEEAIDTVRGGGPSMIRTPRTVAKR